MPLRLSRDANLDSRGVSCPVCDGTDHIPISSHDRHFAPLTNVGCKACGLIFTNPMPTDEALAGFYEQDYRREYQGEATPRPVHLLRGEQRAIERLAALRSHISPPAAILDLGAGAGEFVACLSRAGFAAKGLEPSLEFSAFARRHYGVDVAQGAWQQLSNGIGQFDLVTMHHVLEHLSEPVAALKRIREILKPKGLLAIAVPNIADRRRSPQGRWHIGHVLSFTPETLDMLAQKCGFEPIAGSGTSRLYRMREIPADWAPNSVMALEVLAQVKSHTVLRHYLGATPYRRFLERTRRHANERYLVLPPEKQTRLKRFMAMVGAAVAVAFGVASFE